MRKLLLLIGLLFFTGLSRADDSPSPDSQDGSDSTMSPRMDKNSKEFKQVYDLAGEVFVDKGLRVSGPFAFLSSSGTVNYVDITTMTVSSGTASNWTVKNLTLAPGGTLTGVTGRVVQAVQTTGTTSNSSASGSYVSSVVAGAITVTSASSKVLIIAHTSIRDSTAASNRFEWRFDRSGTSLPTQGEMGPGAAPQVEFPFSATYLDSPATAGSLTYTLQLKVNSGTGGYDINVNGFTWSIILLELS